MTSASSTLSRLRAQSEVSLDSKFSLRSYITTAQRVKEKAERADEDNDVEGAYVGYRKVANLLRAIVDHPDFEAMRKEKKGPYYSYSDLKARVTPYIHRVRDLEERIEGNKGERASKSSLAGPAAASSAINDILAIQPEAEVSESGKGKNAATSPQSAAPSSPLHVLTNGKATTHHTGSSTGTSAGPPPVPPSSTKPTTASSPISPTSVPAPFKSTQTTAPTSSIRLQNSPNGSASLPSSPGLKQSAHIDASAHSTPPVSHEGISTPSPRIGNSFVARMAALYNTGIDTGKLPNASPGHQAAQFSHSSAKTSRSNSIAEGNSPQSGSQHGTNSASSALQPAIHVKSPNVSLNKPTIAHGSTKYAKGQVPRTSSQTMPNEDDEEEVLAQERDSLAVADDPNTIERSESAPPTMPNSMAEASGPAHAREADRLIDEVGPNDGRAALRNFEASGSGLRKSLPLNSVQQEPAAESADNDSARNSFENRFPDVAAEGFSFELPGLSTLHAHYDNINGTGMSKSESQDATDQRRPSLPMPFHPAPTRLPHMPDRVPAVSSPHSVDSPHLTRDRSSSASQTTARYPASTAVPSSNGVDLHHSPPIQAMGNGIPMGLQSKSRPPLPRVPSAPSLPNLKATSITPSELWAIMESVAATKSARPSILLMDVRSRREFQNGHIKGRALCIEPFTLSPNSTAFSITNSLVVSPDEEQTLFRDRAQFDLIILYDRSTRSLPLRPGADGYSAPQNTAGSRNAPLSIYGPSLGIGSNATHPATPEAKTLAILSSAIYEHNFADERNRLKRSPLILAGGFEAWLKDVGVAGIQRAVQTDHVNGRPLTANEGAAPQQSFGKEDEYQAMLRNRQAANGQAVLQPTPASQRADHNVANPGTDNARSSVATNNMASGAVGAYAMPGITMPPVAVHRTGPSSPYEAYPTPSIQSAMSSNFMQANVGQNYFDAHGQHVKGYGMPSQYSNVPQGGSRSIDYPVLQQRQRVNESPAAIRQPLPSLSTQPGGVQVPPPVLARLPSSSFASPTRDQSLHLFQKASYLTNPKHGAFPEQLYAFGDGTVGITGLKNLGNTCYMNSMIQCLSGTVPLARFLKDGSYKKAVNKHNPLGTKGVLADAVAQLIQSLWGQQYSFLAPVTFREAICRFAPQFKGSDQHDSQEFLAFLLDGLHEDLNLVIKKPPPVEFTPEREAELESLPTQIAAVREWNIYLRRDDSIIVRLLQGQYKSQLRCLTCGATSTTYNTFMYLSLPIPGKNSKKVTLSQCIDLFTQPEILDGDDAWNCPKCKKARRASKQLTVSRLPPILLIHLKRFSFSGPFTSRIDSQIEFPVRNLDLSRYVPPPLDPKVEARYASALGGHTEPHPTPLYDLHAVSNHFGSLSSGHYTAYVKNRGAWFELNDSKTIPRDEAHIAMAGKSVYTLWYSLRH